VNKAKTEVVPIGESFEDFHTRKDEWFKHDHADVAAMLLPVTAGLQYRPITLNWFVDGDYKFRPKGKEFGERLVRNATLGLELGPGDDVFFIGLFVQSAGQRQNLPIARFGNISRMPHQELVILSTKARGEVPIRAYLVESHSWGGHSGSPAFWHWEYSEATHVKSAGDEFVTALTTRSFVRAFLGLVSAHFDVGQPAKNQTDVVTDINAGIAVVTPAENVKELLLKDEYLVKDRKTRATVGATSDVPPATPDIAPDKHRQRTTATKEKDRIDIPIPSEQQFFRDLNRATQKRKPSS
jgi:hypothetical protein